MLERADIPRFSGNPSFYKEFLDIVLSQYKGSVWLLDLSSSRLELLGGSTVIPEIGNIVENVPESLLEDYIHQDSRQQLAGMYNRLTRMEDRETAECTFGVKFKGEGYRWQKIVQKVFVDEESRKYAIIFLVEIPTLTNTERLYFQEEQFKRTPSEDVIAVSKVNLTKDRIEKLWAANIDESRLEQVQTYEQMFRIGYQNICSKEDQKKYKQLFGYKNLMNMFSNGLYDVAMECRYKNPDGKIVWAFMTAALLGNSENDVMYYSFIRNITVRKKLELALRQKAEKDALTGLYNKITVQLLIQEAMRLNGQDGLECALLLIDVDNFTKVNDSYGHLFGDQILTEVSTLIRSIFGSKGIVGRFGGDEFIVFIRGLDSQHEVLKGCEDLFMSMRHIYMDKVNALEITVSAGITYAKLGEASFQKMYEEADTALYDAKFKGKAKWEVYGKNLREAITPYIYERCLAKDYLGKSCMMEEIEEMAFIINTDTYDLLYMNAGARKTFPEIDLLKKIPKCYEALQGFTKPCPFCNEHVPREDRFNVWYNTNYKLQRHFIIKDKMIVQKGKNYRFEIFFDAEQLEKANHALLDDILIRCIESLISEEDIGKALHSVLYSIGEFYGADRTYVVEVNARKNLGSVIYEWCAPGIIPQKENLQNVDMEKLPRWKKALDDSAPIVLNDRQEIREDYPQEYELLRMQDVNSLYVVPFKIGDELVGYVGIDNPDKNLGVITFLSTLAFLTGTEISRRRLYQKQSYINSYDLLTGLLNRSCYIDYIQHMEIDALSSLGVMTADVNGLKHINEEFGHPYGDSLLQYIANILSSTFKDAAVFRFSGDEFLVLCLDMTQEAFSGLVHRAVDEIESQYIDCISHGYTWAETDIDVERMVRHAGEFMMIAKREHYTRSRADVTYVHPYVLEELLRSLSQHRYVMYLQPKVNIATGEICGAEALVRYINPDGSITGPGEFVRILERQNYIHYIDMFIFEEVCKAIADWRAKGYRLFPVSLNFSRTTLLETNLIQDMNRISKEYDIPRKYLEIEITESFGDVELETIKSVGDMIVNNSYQLSLDDFGAKYSNIGILSIIRLDTLKLDKTLVNSLYSQRSLKIVVKNLITACHEIDVKCVAEGVETEEQLQILKELKCDYAQGYYFNKPIPADVFEKKYLQ